MKSILQTLPETPLFPGVTHIIAVPAEKFSKVKLAMLRLGIPVHIDSDGSKPIRANNVPEMEVTLEESSTDKAETTITFRTSDLTPLNGINSFIVNTLNGQMLIPVIPPHTGKTEITRSTSTPGTDPADYNVKITIPASPIKLT